MVLEAARWERPRPQTASPTICGLVERGSIAAARAALFGEEARPRPAPDAALRDELQRKNPKPTDEATTLSQDEWSRMAAEVRLACDALLAEARISDKELLAAARRARRGAAPGPDGWSGGLLQRMATIFPVEITRILRRVFTLLCESEDPLAVATLLEATVGGLPKPAGGNRPIVIAQCVTRCILAHAVKLRRAELVKGHQYCMSGVLPCVARLWRAVAYCSAERIPWCVTNVDLTNAYNAVSKGAR